ncbi:hypothetical protein GGI35DRAFT_476044 [Trichoderma velutinum]
MDSPVRDNEASPLQDEPEDLTHQDRISLPISEPIDSDLQNELNDSSEPTWQQKALAAGRTPLPSSRPPIKALGTYIADSGRTPRESSVDSLETELEQLPEQEQKLTAKGESLHPTSNDKTKVKKPDARPKRHNARGFVTITSIGLRRVQRRKWRPSEIQSLIRMRQDKMSWELIAGAFSNRTVAGVRQTFFKYRLTYHDMDSGEE